MGIHLFLLYHQQITQEMMEMCYPISLSVMLYKIRYMIQYEMIIMFIGCINIVIKINVITIGKFGIHYIQHFWGNSKYIILCQIHLLNAIRYRNSFKLQ